jgi:hypothetical protein
MAAASAGASPTSERGQPSPLSSSMARHQQPANLPYRAPGDGRPNQNDPPYHPDDARMSPPLRSLSNEDLTSDSLTPPNQSALSPGLDRSGRDQDLDIAPAKRDRSRQTGSRRPSGSRICGKCGGNLTGQFVRALENTYHLECFTCHVRRTTPPSCCSA